MSKNNKEPGETLAVILIVVALCVIGWTLFVPFAGLFYRVFYFMPRLIGFRPYYQQWQGVVHFPATQVQIQFLVMGVLIGLVLFALASIIRAINANTRELRQIKETLKTAAPK
jgi:uncharacterized membrane protein